MKNFFYKFVELLRPKTIIGGLEISDAAIRFLRVTKTNTVAQQASLALPTGIVHGGRVKDRGNLVAALSELKKVVEPKEKKFVEVVLSLSSENVYAQTIFLPSAASENLEEAARLNIQMLSPIGLASAYFDWQQIKRKEGGYSDQIEILSALVNKGVVNEFADVLRESGFAVVAIDFTALSLARLLRKLSTSLNSMEPAMVLFISSDGIELFITRAGELYFSYFQSWDAFRGAAAQRTLSYFHEFIANEIARVSNFYQTRYQVAISNVLVVAPGLYEEVERALNRGMPAMRIGPLIVKEFTHTPSYWYVALGAALRARTPRYQDNELSLMSLNTKDEYALIRAAVFARFWRNIAWVVGSFLVFICAAVLILIVRYGARVKENIAQQVVRSPVDAALFADIQAKAASFNKLVDFAYAIEGSLIDWSPFLERITALSGPGISLEKVSVSKSGDVNLSAMAITGDAALAFRDTLTKEPGVTDVRLPLIDLFGKGSGIVRFSVSLKVDINVFGR